MGRLFGTDGVRGMANTELTPELAFALGRYGALVLAGHVAHKPCVLVGTDTRISCSMLEAALVAGICSAGADAKICGVIPTPGIAYLTNISNSDAGVVISASHNSYEYNGIKFFNKDGFKLADSIEDEIENYIKGVTPDDKPRLTGKEVGHRIDYPEASNVYCDHLRSILSVDLKGMKIAIDCANGASYKIAPQLFRSLGAEIVTIGIEPDGININDKCGSTHMDKLCSMVVKEKCTLGLAFDGDADRLLAVDDEGNLIDGDEILAIMSLYMHKKGTLKKESLVVTVMSNLGLDIFAQANGIKTIKTAVGDRYVLEEMLKSGYNIGGEQSGHIILLDHATTGDGMLSALCLLDALKGSGQKLSHASKVMTVLPQVQVKAHIPNASKSIAMNDTEILGLSKKMELSLNGKGRVLVRPSGTEPVIRVMLEGEDKQAITAMSEELAALISKKYGDA